MNTLKKQYTSLLDKLNDSKRELNTIPVQHNNCVAAKSNIIATITREIENVENELRDINSTAWDNLVIAFFGETNAGKSTIIETFRILYDQNRIPGNDGLIVGDGSSDFTKDYHEYKLNMNGIPFTLIDVPGIEGNEKEFKDVIKEALHKAHLVFYVQGHNKKPDVATAQKIKNYLGQWVYVYSIQNVRGGVSNYDEEEERETLLTDSVMKVDQLIQGEFRKILGNVYKGNIVMQAQLALCAKGAFSNRQDLKGYQDKLNRYFGSAESSFKFSRFNEIEQFVKESSQSYPAMIEQANRQKLQYLKSRLWTNIQKIPTSELEAAKSELDRYLKSVKSAISDSRRSVENRCSASLEKRLEELRSELCKDVVIDELSKYAASDQRKCENNIKKDFNSIFTEESNALHERLERLRMEMRFINIGDFNTSSDGIHTNVSTYNAKDALSYGFGDFVGQTLSTGGTAATGAALGSFLGPVGTIVGGVAGGILGFFFGDSKSERRSKAKNEIRKAINEAKTKVKNDLPANLEKGPFLAFNRIQWPIESQIGREIQNIDRLLTIVENLYSI